MTDKREARYIEAIESEDYRNAPDRAGAESVARAVMAVADAERRIASFDEEQRIARLITSSVAGRHWRELSPIDIARHLVANGVRVAFEVDNGRD
jgi:hypothetical protein